MKYYAVIDTNVLVSAIEPFIVTPREMMTMIASETQDSN